MACGSAFVVRDSDGRPVAAGVLVVNEAYGDPTAVDANMPCFRLAAFGTEGLQWKRLRGMFTFVASPGREVNALALQLLAHAAGRLTETDLGTLAAQVPSDAPHLLRFYQQLWHRQGAFPVGGLLDLSKGPQVLHVPDMAGRYYSVQFTDPSDGTNFAYVGKRTTGTAAGEYLISGPGWKGTVSQGMAQIVSPDNAALVIGRVFVESASDLPTAYGLAKQIRVTTPHA